VKRHPAVLDQADLVREATAADLDGLTALEADCFGGDAWTRSMLEEELRRPGGILRVCGDPVLAYVAGWAVADELHLLRIAARPNMRRRGLASALHDDLLRQAGGRAQTAWLEVRADNAGALAFYARHGWGPAGRRPRYYSDATDAIVMRRSLGNLIPDTGGPDTGGPERALGAYPAPEKG
jgi:ribosomal-protein-alanine acetyltransferase